MIRPSLPVFGSASLSLPAFFWLFCLIWSSFSSRNYFSWWIRGDSCLSQAGTLTSCSSVPSFVMTDEIADFLARHMPGASGPIISWTLPSACARDDCGSNTANLWNSFRFEAPTAGMVASNGFFETGETLACESQRFSKKSGKRDWGYLQGGQIPLNRRPEFSGYVEKSPGTAPSWSVNAPFLHEA